MTAKISELVSLLDSIAPRELAYDWDNVGLQVGDPEQVVHKALVALEVTPEVVAEASESGAELIVAHHPVIFGSISSVALSQPHGRLLSALIMEGIAVFVMHTNLDVVEGGVNDALADTVELQDVQILEPVRSKNFKLVVFVPEEATGRVLEAIGAAGGGIIGNYTHCSFRVSGLGTFKPEEGAHPSVGEVGRLNEVKEDRVEVLVESTRLSKVIEAMLASHPYEEVAYDVYAVESMSEDQGLGRVGRLEKPLALADAVRFWEDRLKSRFKVAGKPTAKIERLAVCGGSGGGLFKAAHLAVADALLTGDVKYHQALEANALGLVVVDAGHGVTERPVLPRLRRRLQESLSESGLEVEVLQSQVVTDPWQTD